MAEAAGLAVGVLTLASLFDTCMSTFARLDAGRNCSKDYQEAALKVTFLGNRLRRWEEVYRASAPSDTGREALLAEYALESINESLETLVNSSDRYQMQASSTAVASLTERIQTLTIAKRVKTSVRSKVVWALHDKDKFNQAISSVKFKMDELEKLTRGLVQARQAEARREAEELILPSAIEEPETTIPIMNACAAEVDPEFQKAAEAASTMPGHKFKNIYTDAKARVELGNYIAAGYSGLFAGFQHSYDGVRTLGEARGLMGDSYGGKHVFDD